MKIKCKLIRMKSDIDNEEQRHLFDEDNSDGMLQVSVTDTGIGIKLKDQEKLFKLFGFLDSSKHLNSKGIGLGLHISKRITQQFNGDIMLKSEWGSGTEFTFLFQLSQKQTGLASVKRILNPIKKKY